MPCSSLFDFLRVQNIWVKATLGGVKNILIPQPKLHSSVRSLFDKTYLTLIISCDINYQFPHARP
jgi:hypothetical protein